MKFAAATTLYGPTDSYIDNLLSNAEAFPLLFVYDNSADNSAYVDRLRGAKLGIYERAVADCLAGYPVPQESGNHCGVRRIQVTDRRGRGVEFFGDSLSVNVLPWTPHELENAAHAHELPPVHYTVVRAALQQMGIGGDDSWGARTHPEYLLPAEQDLSFSFCFRGI